jgi:hypothetical protein
MELNINRLKVLGEEELQRLDEKVLQHQASTETTILTKSIDEIQRKINDTNSVIVQLTRNLNTKQSQLSKLQADFSASEKKYIKSEEDVDKLEKSIANLQAEIDLKQVKFSEMDENIVRLKTNERVLKEQLTDLDSKLSVRTEQFLKEQDDIQTQIKELEQKLKMSIQNSFTQHDEFVKHVKSIKLEPSIDDCQAIFDNIKMDLVLVLSRNIEKCNKFIGTQFMKSQRASNGSYCGNIMLDNIHSTICIGDKYVVITNELISGSASHKHKCTICGYNLPYENDKNAIGRRDVQSVEEESIKWLENNYKTFLSQLITHKELKYIIEKLNYSQFKDLFIKSKLFYLPTDLNVTSNGKTIRSYFNSYEFLMFVLFIGTNGEINYEQDFSKLKPN